MAYFLVPDAILFDLAHFLEIQLVCDRRTDGRTDGPTDGRTHPLLEMRERISKVDFP